MREQQQSMRLLWEQDKCKHTRLIGQNKYFWYIIFFFIYIFYIFYIFLLYSILLIEYLHVYILALWVFNKHSEYETVSSGVTMTFKDIFQIIRSFSFTTEPENRVRLGSGPSADRWSTQNRKLVIVQRSSCCMKLLHHVSWWVRASKADTWSSRRGVWRQRGDPLRPRRQRCEAERRASSCCSFLEVGVDWFDGSLWSLAPRLAARRSAWTTGSTRCRPAPSLERV